MTSSASTPSTRSTGRPGARLIVSSGSTCDRRSFGMGGRFALYSVNSSSRKVLPLASKTTAMRCFGLYSFTNLSSMFSTPNTAPVGSPREFEKRR